MSYPLFPFFYFRGPLRRFMSLSRSGPVICVKDVHIDLILASNHLKLAKDNNWRSYNSFLTIKTMSDKVIGTKLKIPSIKQTCRANRIAHCGGGWNVSRSIGGVVSKARSDNGRWTEFDINVWTLSTGVTWLSNRGYRLLLSVEKGKRALQLGCSWV